MRSKEWYEDLPIFNNEKPISPQNFSSIRKFKDPFFPAHKNSLVTQNRIYELKQEKSKIENELDKKKKHFYPKDSDIKNLERQLKNIESYLNDAYFLNQIDDWERISDIFPNYELFPRKLHADTFCQGKIGDCYFLSVISIISNYGELLTRLFPIPKNNYGYYEIILFINGWKRVIIDDFIPGNRDSSGFEPITSMSNKYTNCFYHILLEKAFAKISKGYFNICGGFASSAFLVLTGYNADTIFFNTINSQLERTQLFENFIKGIRKDGLLFAINTKRHCYSVLDAEAHEINNRIYKILKIRNPWGKVGNNLISEEIQKNPELKRFIKYEEGQYRLNTKLIVEPELIAELENYDFTSDNGIFLMSEKYVFTFFKSYNKCFTIFDGHVIEYLFKFDNRNQNFNEYYFCFRMKTIEKSLVQFNLTKHTNDNHGKIFFDHYKIKFKIKDLNNNIYEQQHIYRFKENKEYIIEWCYEDEVPNEILFWVIFDGEINLDFIGIKETETSIIDYRINILPKKQTYKLNEKLGDFYRRKSKIYNFISNNLHINMNAPPEERGYSVEYKEFGDLSFTFIMNTRNLKKIFLSQNLDYPEFVFKGENEYNHRIMGEGSIYTLESLERKPIYNGKIILNSFPQNIRENDNNQLVVDVTMKRFNLAELDTLIRLNISEYGPFEGERFWRTLHPHRFIKCLTGRVGWTCDACKKSFYLLPSYYCSLCDFDICDENCSKINRSNIPYNLDSFTKYNYESKQHQHKLILVRKIFNRANLYKCFSCLKKIQNNSKFYFCTNCDFKLCWKCKNIEERGEEWQFHSCWHEHPLTFCRTQGFTNISVNDIKKLQEKQHKNEKSSINIIEEDEKLKIKFKEDYDFFYECNHCGVEYSRNKESFYCTACDFHICIKCYKNYFFFEGRDKENAKNVAMQNREIFPTYCRCYLGNDSLIKSVNCHKCKKLLNLDNWTYYCSNCNSNFCNECYKYHRVIFKDNILVFDGNFSEKNIELRHGPGIVYKLNNEINYKGDWINGIFPLLNDIPHDHPFRRNLNFIQLKNATFVKKFAFMIQEYFVIFVILLFVIIA